MTEYRSSSLLKAKIKEFEGLCLEAYRCAGGVWTIGYGHTDGVKPGDRISQHLANEYLEQDLHTVEQQVNALGVCTRQGSFDALVSFVFNLGITALSGSTLLRVIRLGGTEEEIRAEFGRWVYSRGVRLVGLVKRRAWEAERFFQSGVTPL